MKFLIKLLILNCVQILLIMQFANLHSQEKYKVFLTDKKDCSFNPYLYFDSKAIERRMNAGLPICDSSDMPVNENYLNLLTNFSDSISSVSRWFNLVFLYAKPEQIEYIKSLAFVKNVEIVSTAAVFCNISDSSQYNVNEELLKILSLQRESLNSKAFDSAGYDGKGIRIAIFDGGFPKVNTSKVFKHIRDEGRIIKTWDFTKKREFVYDYSPHGTMVMSCIGGIFENTKIGFATGAEFLLARTEINREPFSEEENWLQAVEWADKNGAHIINSSLGYTYHRYFNYQMDGKTSLVAKAGNLAAKKGILVVNAAGNEGSSKWKFIGTPADADSVLSVGGIDPETLYHISFSSFGPTSDGRLKPNVCAFGEVAAEGKKGLTRTQGTSFASPLVAGFAACAWQAKQNLTNMQLFQEIEKSGHLYPYFDYAHGYGMPQAQYFINGAKEIPEESFSIKVVNEEILISVKKEFIYESIMPLILYYNIQNQNGKLEYYKVISVREPEVAQVIITENLKGKKLNVHFAGCTKTIDIK